MARAAPPPRWIRDSVNLVCVCGVVHVCVCDRLVITMTKTTMMAMTTMMMKTQFCCRFAGLTAPPATAAGHQGALPHDVGHTDGRGDICRRQIDVG